MANDDSQLPLSDLKRWISEETLQWLQEAEVKDKELEKEKDEVAATAILDLFDNGDDEEENRVHKWSPDGSSIEIIYVISTKSWHGFGDIVWSSSRHISNLLVDEQSCRKLLSTSTEAPHHPLQGVNFLELGAGAGIPSWVAMHCGARVVCTDQAVPDRIRCLAEAAERNCRLRQNLQVQACGHNWGKDTTPILNVRGENGEKERFGIIVAADCLYMPWMHDELLDSIDECLSDTGVALLPFCLHGNTKDDDVWRIVDRAKEKGFRVNLLEPKQLPPPGPGMDAKQGFVNTVRLTR
jgi:hypothetical protein